MSNLSFTKKIVFNSQALRKVQSFQTRSGKNALYRVKGGREKLDCFLTSRK